jgi:hypothetical protein
MAATETGVTGYVHGHGSLTSTAFTTDCIIVGDLSLKMMAANKSEIKNGAGNVITRRYDDINKTLPVTIKLKGTYTELTVAQTVTVANCAIEAYNSTYEIEDISCTLKSGDYAEYQASLVRTEYIVNA